MSRACLWILASLLIASSTVRAADRPDCYSGTYAKRIEACSAVIDDPEADAQAVLDARMTRGLILSDIGRYAEAIGDLDKVVEAYPDWARVLNGRAWLLFRWKRGSEGLADVEKALVLEPGDGPSWDTRAHIRQVMGEADGAFNDYEAAIGFGGVAFVRMYQCGLSKRGLYKGKIDGIYDEKVRAALKSCASSKQCDPLPDNVNEVIDNKVCEETVS